MHKCIGDYEFHDDDSAIIGRGTHGVVYVGRHRHQHDERVAVKRIDAEAVEQDHLDIIKGLRSDYIVHIHTVEILDPYAYIILELCEGTLEDHLNQLMVDNQRISLENLETIMKSMAYGYSELTENCIIHRDIKPQNILLKYKPNEYCVNGARKIAVAKYTDFGLSQMHPTRGSLTRLAGTPLYMAPGERGWVVCAQADVCEQKSAQM
jgi:serine/threonine protein kinase